MRKAEKYLQQIELESNHAEEAIQIANEILRNQVSDNPLPSLRLTRKETAEYLQITIDTLSNWELNGLITIKRSENGYRVYCLEDIKRLTMIRSLRCANYSLTSILRMLETISHNPAANLRDTIDTPIRMMKLSLLVINY